MSFEEAADPGTRIAARVKAATIKINSIGFAILVSPKTVKIFSDLILSIAELLLSYGNVDIHVQLRYKGHLFICDEA